MKRGLITMRAVRVVSVAALAVACVTCAEQPLVRSAGYARVPLAPLFAVAPAGGPDIVVTKIRGVLRGANDSTVTEGLVTGDSAILEFEKVVVQGDSSKYTLGLTALDANNIVLFTGEDTLQVKPGNNAPARPDLNYTAPDAAVATIDISVTALTLDWAGAAVGNTTCLSKVPDVTKVTQQQLAISGKTAGNIAVPNVRVGWTSRDTTVFTVNASGLVKSRCSNKSAYLVARTFLDKADSILVTVNAPAFSLIMSPDSSTIARGSTQQLTALVVDENNNVVPAASVSWFSSDTLRAKVSSTGLVTGVSSGRVLITAASGNRTTVAVVQVVRPAAAKVVVMPVVPLDSLGVGQSRTYFAKALDASNKVIPEASGFSWTSTAPAVAGVNSATGLASALTVGSAKIVASLDGKTDTVRLSVVTSMPPGSIRGKVTNAATGAALAGVSLISIGNSATTAADGSYQLNGLQSGDSIALSLGTFVTAIAYNVPVFPNKILDVPTVSLSPTGGTGTITGKVVNALTNSVVSGFTVKAYKGINGAPSAKRPVVTPDFTVTTDANGIFTISNAAAGTYTLFYSTTGYSDTFGSANAVSGQTKTVADALVAPTAVGGGIYIVVTWGGSADCTIAANNVPCNLDAHLTGPKIAPDTVPPRFQVYSGNQRYVVGTDTIANLDLGATNGRGPEILSLRPAAPAPVDTMMYRFYVHNATAGTTANKALADSASARVDVYQDGHLVGTFFPPAGVSGNVWNVFKYDGARLIPITVNAITTETTPGVLAIRAAPETKPKKQD